MLRVEDSEMGHVSVLGEPAVQRGHRAWIRAVLLVTQLLGCMTLGYHLTSVLKFSLLFNAVISIWPPRVTLKLWTQVTLPAW